MVTDRLGWFIDNGLLKHLLIGFYTDDRNGNDDDGHGDDGGHGNDDDVDGRSRNGGCKWW